MQTKLSGMSSIVMVCMFLPFLSFLRRYNLIEREKKWRLECEINMITLAIEVKDA